MGKKNGKRKYILLAAAALIAALIAVGKHNGTEGIEVILQSPVPGTIEETIPANGKIQPVTEVKISPDVSGEIIKLNFEEGDAVKKGDLILQIKPDLYISARDRAEASLNAIKAQYAQQQAQFIQSELNYKRNRSLYEKGTISSSDFIFHKSLSLMRISSAPETLSRFEKQTICFSMSFNSKSHIASLHL
jgi:HlyD family secretion protein